MTSFSSKLNRMRSVKLSFTNNKKREQQQQQEEDSRYRTPEQYHYQQQKQQQRPFGTNNNNYVETLRVLSTEAKQTQYNDVFDSFFFNDKRCQNRAFFMAGRLKANLDYHPSSSTAMRASSSFGNLPLTNPPTTPTTLMNIRPSPSQSTPVPNNTSFQASNDYTKSATPTAAASVAAANTKNQLYVDSFWRMITHRLYTLNYILFVLPPDSETRIAFLNRLESDLNKVGDGQELYRRGGMEAHFAVRYALEHKHGYNKLRRRKTLLEDAFELERRQKKMNGEAVTVGDVCGVERSVNPDHERLCEQARLIIEQCLESEGRLAHQEKDAMYVFHGMRAGLMGAFEPHVELEEDRDLRHLLKDVVHQNKKPPYENPFEDEDCIVREEDDDDYDEDDKREVDSGFYDNCSSSV